MINNPYNCPKCGRPGSWRHGLYFEHEMICFCGGNRSITWDPDKRATPIQKKQSQKHEETTVINKKEEVVVCDTCKGKGLIYWDELVDYHKGTYVTQSRDCNRCKNRGILLKTTVTEVEIRAITDEDFKPCRTHNGQSSS